LVIGRAARFLNHPFGQSPLIRSGRGALNEVRQLSVSSTVKGAPGKLSGACRTSRIERGDDAADGIGGVCGDGDVEAGYA